MTRLRFGHAGFRIPAKARDFCSLFCLYWLWDPPDFLLNGNRACLQWSKRCGCEVTTRLHLVLTLRMCGAILLLPLYAFMAWTGINLLFTSMIRAMTEAVGSSFRSKRCHILEDRNLTTHSTEPSGYMNGGQFQNQPSDCLFAPQKFPCLINSVRSWNCLRYRLR